MIATIISVVITIAIVWGGWFIDQKTLGCKTRIRAVLGLVPLGIGSWVCSLISFAFLLRAPGAYGPVQYWVGSDSAASDFMLYMRAIAFFAILLGLLFAALSLLATASSLAYLAYRQEGYRLRLIVVPSAGLAAYGLSWLMFFKLHFYPTA
jgi:hypothetical protein